MDACFFATSLVSRYSKGEEQFDTSVLVVGKGKTYAESEVRSAKKPGTR